MGAIVYEMRTGRAFRGRWEQPTQRTVSMTSFFFFLASSVIRPSFCLYHFSNGNDGRQGPIGASEPT
jgi:hypothetical protein